MLQSVLQTFRRRFARYLRRDTPLHASTTSLLACMVLAAGSLILGMFERSLIIQTNGLIALIDIGNSVLFIAAVERSTRAPDLAFNYGYGKYESLAVLISANLLVVLGIFTLIESVGFLQRPPESANTWLLTAWAAISFLLMRVVSKRLSKYAKRFHQPMLQYDAELWRVDSLVEMGVLAGVAFDGVLLLFGMVNAAAVSEAILSVALVAFSLKVPLQHGREAFRQLLDRTLPDKMQYDVLGVIADNAKDMCEFKRVHTRQSGKDIFIEIDLVMPFDHTLEELFVFEQKMLKGLRERFPTAIPRVYVTPCDHRCELPTGFTCPLKRTPTATS